MGAQLRVEIRLKNAALWNALLARCPHPKRAGRPRIQTAADLSGVPFPTIHALVSLRQDPRRVGSNEFIPTADRLAAFLGVDPETLYPRELYAGIFHREIVGEIDSDRFLSMTEARTLRLLPRSTEELEAPENPWTLVSQEEIRSAIDSRLSRLTPLQRKILERRFGLNGCEPETLREIGESFGRSHEIIRQEEARALKRMRPAFGAKPTAALEDFIGRQHGYSERSCV